MRRLLLPVIASIIVIVFAAALNHNHAPYFREVEAGYADGSIVNLAPGFDVNALAKILIAKHYVSDSDEALFIASEIARKMDDGRSLSKINDLRLRAWQIKRPADLPYPSLSSRIRTVREHLGHDRLGRLSDFTPVADIGAGNGIIEVAVTAPDSTAGRLSKFFHRDRVPQSSTVVWLNLHDADIDTIIGYQLTDERGHVTFSGLDTRCFYSVIPCDSLYEYGRAKGTVNSSLCECVGSDSTLSVTFAATPFSVRLLSDNTLSAIRAERLITVRTPAQFTHSLFFGVILVVALFWVLIILILRKNPKASTVLPSVLLLIAGIGVVNMFAVSSPLTDALLGSQNVRGVSIGLILACLLTFIDPVKFYQNRSSITIGGRKFTVPFDFFLVGAKWMCLPMRDKVRPFALVLTSSDKGTVAKTTCLVALVVMLPLILLGILLGWARKYVETWPKGTGYLIAAIILTALLFPFGSEVGGMKVNLNIGIPVQPSEVAKYFMVIFMAAYFCENASTIISYSGESVLTGRLFHRKLRLMLGFLIGIFVLMGLYLLLSDLGPALVILVTFVLFYSLIKSTVSISDTDTPAIRLRKILTCDLAMLIYGVISFIGFYIIGQILGAPILFALIWFPCWIGFFLIRRRIYESAILFNVIIALFLFGGSLLRGMGLDSDAERFDQRLEMCSNTWGVISQDVALQDPTSNSQVAAGLWALASGGHSGQGLGQGLPQVIPAFNTDMVLMSFGENLGFWGLLVLFALYAILLWQTLKVGYLARHRFAMYLCMGIAIVTGVQLLAIAMGSLGLIPLTGVTVAFMSFGMASLIMNFFGFGLVLSILAHTDNASLAPTSRSELMKTSRKYEYPMSLLSVVTTILLLIIVGSYAQYTIFERDTTLVRPVYSVNLSGMPQIDYNPRIRAVADKLRSGDIFDRSGMLLASSSRDKVAEAMPAYHRLGLSPMLEPGQKRYYPFSEHLFFMLGDINSGLLFSYSDHSPLGLVAEAQFLSELRGYDNMVYGPDGQPVKVTLVGNKVRRKRFSSQVADTIEGVILRDYSPLIPYLKAGINSDLVNQFNSDSPSGPLSPGDITLTIDARLQTRLQQEMARHISTKFPGDRWSKIRSSVVVIDAEHGDLLASANYPLPDYDRLADEYEQRRATGYHAYNDLMRPYGWKAFTDMDLGLTYATAPGSTAKVMTSLAYFMKYPGGVRGADPKYTVYSDERIYKYEPSGTLDMRMGLRHSSNVYFIKLMNDQQLFPQLAEIYGSAGVMVDGHRPFALYPHDFSSWTHYVTDQSDRSVGAYHRYVAKGEHRKMNNKSGYPDQWSWAWGQNGVDATPHAMARIAATVANSGRMPHPRYRIDSSIEYDTLVSPSDAAHIGEYMKFTALQHDRFGSRADRLGGKTGTPERAWTHGTNNDGWYICFIEGVNIPGSEGTGKIAVAVRMERVFDGTSGRAVAMMKEVVIPMLEELGYIKPM